MNPAPKPTPNQIFRAQLREKIAGLEQTNAALALGNLMKRLEDLIIAEDAELHKLGVAWESAHTAPYRFAQGILDDIDEVLGEVFVKSFPPAEEAKVEPPPLPEPAKEEIKPEPVKPSRRSIFGGKHEKAKVS